MSSDIFKYQPGAALGQFMETGHAADARLWLWLWLWLTNRTTPLLLRTPDTSVGGCGPSPRGLCLYPVARARPTGAIHTHSQQVGSGFSWLRARLITLCGCSPPALPLRSGLCVRQHHPRIARPFTPADERTRRLLSPRASLSVFCEVILVCRCV